MTSSNKNYPVALGLAPLFAAALLLAATGCGKSDGHGKSSGTRATDFPTNVTAHEVKGVLEEIRNEGTKALIAHEDIPGYMEAMTMLLDVRPTNSLAGLQPGDQIRFRMLTTDDDGWIDRLEKIGTNRVAIAPRAPSILDAELHPGDLPPDITLTNQLGQVIRLGDFKGSALAFTFIFTRCPFPTFCPRMNQNFLTVQKDLLAANAGTNWHLLSISFDPEYDTPERLANYARNSQHDPAHWSFATSTTNEVRRLGNAFTLAFGWEGGTINHNLRTVVIGANGRIQKIFPSNEWTSAELAEEMKKAMLVKE